MHGRNFRVGDTIALKSTFGKEVMGIHPVQIIQLPIKEEVCRNTASWIIIKVRQQSNGGMQHDKLEKKSDNRRACNVKYGECCFH